MKTMKSESISGSLFLLNKMTNEHLNDDFKRNSKNTS